VPRLADVYLGLPIQKNLLQLDSRGKAEKCTFCYPRIEAGQPTVCSETCVGRIRYLGRTALRCRQNRASRQYRKRTGSLYEAQLGVFLDPNDPELQTEALKQGIPQSLA
jgi:nitrate reductase beta subunit